MGEAMTKTASLSVQSRGIQPVGMPDLHLMLAAGRLPDAPLSMPTQVLERAGPRLAPLRDFLFGPLGSAGT